MVDLYVDDITLSDIQRKDKEILVFTNKEKDESIRIPVSNEELVNIFHRVRMRCETLNLIPVVNR